MLLDAARSRGIELPASWMIGDSDVDVEAGRNAGCKTARLLTTNKAMDESGRCGGTRNYADIIARSLLDAVRQILHCEGAAVGSFTADPAVT
jgi:histidinol phosphatase-like enzyme